MEIVFFFVCFWATLGHIGVAVFKKKYPKKYERRMADKLPPTIKTFVWVIVVVWIGGPLSYSYLKKGKL